MVNIIETLELHDTLNQKLFDGDVMKPEVRNKALQIANFFMEQLPVHVQLLDVYLLGSNAAYNYNDKSDFDLHILVDFDQFDAEQAILRGLFDTNKVLFKQKYQIKIKGYDVEMYVQGLEDQNASNGVYSILDNKWIKKPVKIDKYPEYENLQQNIDKWANDIDEVILSGDIDKIQFKKIMLYVMRKNSITADGEFAQGNLIFKELRNMGYLDKLNDSINKLSGKDLTLEWLA